MDIDGNPTVPLGSPTTPIGEDAVDSKLLSLKSSNQGLNGELLRTHPVLGVKAILFSVQTCEPLLAQHQTGTESPDSVPAALHIPHNYVDGTSNDGQS